MKSIEIEYFAILKDQSHKSHEKFDTTSLTLKDLYIELQDKYQFSLNVDMIQVAVNDEFSSLSKEFSEGDKIVFIPPVAGG